MCRRQIKQLSIYVSINTIVSQAFYVATHLPLASCFCIAAFFRRFYAARVEFVLLPHFQLVSIRRKLLLFFLIFYSYVVVIVLHNCQVP